MVRDLLLPPRFAARDEASVAVVDDAFGPTSLACSLAVPPGADDLVLLVHGLGGDRRAGYVRRAAAVLHREGFATLAIDLRGADRRGGGFYHVALTEDLSAACRSPLAAPFARVFVLGFSMGGHVAIHFAAERSEPRLRGVAALCAPLDLLATQRALDRPALAFYRRYVLRSLKRIYAAVARRHAVPSPAAQVACCRTFREWDRLTIAPRYGYADPEAFYAAHSARSVLPALAVETLLVLARQDPIVPPALAMPWVAAAPVGRLRVVVLPRGGHLRFAGRQDLGLGAPRGPGVVEQIAAHWRAVASATAHPFA